MYAIYGVRFFQKYDILVTESDCPPSPFLYAPVAIALEVHHKYIKKKNDNLTEGADHALDTRDTTPSGWAVMSAPRHHALDIMYYNTYGRRYSIRESHIFYAWKGATIVRTHSAGRFSPRRRGASYPGAPPTYAVRQMRGAGGRQPRPPLPPPPPIGGA